MRRHKVLYILFLLVVVCVLFSSLWIEPQLINTPLSRRILKLITQLQ